MARMDLGALTMNGNVVQSVYVDGRIIWGSEDTGFSHILDELYNSPKPGIFLTPVRNGDKAVRVRFGLNRHCLLWDEFFRDSNGSLYRDVDAKGVGYTKYFPIRVVPIQDPETDDIEIRGLLHDEIARYDCLNTEEIHNAGARVARYVARIELLELVDKDGNIQPREELEGQVGRNLDVVKPNIAIRAQGTTARIWDVIYRSGEASYIREILEDARGLVSKEFSYGFTPMEYAEWFYMTLAKQLALLHRNNMRTDFGMQIHMGMHNVTLDCRLLDTFHYYTPKGREIRVQEEIENARNYNRDPILFDYSEDYMNQWRMTDIELCSNMLVEFSRAMECLYDLKNLDRNLTPVAAAAYKENV